MPVPNTDRRQAGRTVIVMGALKLHRSKHLRSKHHQMQPHHTAASRSSWPR